MKETVKYGQSYENNYTMNLLPNFFNTRQENIKEHKSKTTTTDKEEIKKIMKAYFVSPYYISKVVELAGAMA